MIQPGNLAHEIDKFDHSQILSVHIQVHDEIIIDRCVGRRLDPVTGKIYHLKYFPPETEEVSARLITRSDDTQEKVTFFCYSHALLYYCLYNKDEKHVLCASIDLLM